MGRDYSHVKEGYRRHEHERHSLYYKRTKTGVLITRILGPGQDPIRNLSKYKTRVVMRTIVELAPTVIGKGGHPSKKNQDRFPIKNVGNDEEDRARFDVWGRKRSITFRSCAIHEKMQRCEKGLEGS